jgi:hypothetical protein
MDDEKASCVNDSEENAQLSLQHLPIEVCMQKKKKSVLSLLSFVFHLRARKSRFFSLNRRCHLSSRE